MLKSMRMRMHEGVYALSDNWFETIAASSAEPSGSMSRRLLEKRFVGKSVCPHSLFKDPFAVTASHDRAENRKNAYVSLPEAVPDTSGSF